MFFEYALDPAVLSDWKSVRYFLDAMGPWKGRLLAEYPRSWKKLVYQGLHCRDVEKARVEERLRRIEARVFVRRLAAQYDGTTPWLDNAVAEHGREPFRAIVSTDTHGKAFILDGEEVDESNDLWRVEQGTMVPRDPSAVARALSLLLRVSSRVVIIDPYFRADQPDKTAPLVALCQVLGPEAASKVEVHFADGCVSCKFGMDHAERALPGLLARGTKVTLRCWSEKPRGKRLHNRYILTDVGGVQFGDSIERGGAAHRDRLSILEESSRAGLWEDFLGAAPAFEPVGAPREFECRAKKK